MLRACARPRNFAHVFCAFVYTCIHSCLHAFERHTGKELDGQTITCVNARQPTYDQAPAEGAGSESGPIWTQDWLKRKYAELKAKKAAAKAEEVPRSRC